MKFETGQTSEPTSANISIVSLSSMRGPTMLRWRTRTTCHVSQNGGEIIIVHSHHLFVACCIFNHELFHDVFEVSLFVASSDPLVLPRRAF